MKHFGIVILVVFATCLTITYAQSQVTFGTVEHKDVVIFKFPISKESKPMVIASQTVFYPPKGIAQRYIITGVRVTDSIKNGTGGYVSLLSGGPGYKNVTLNFTSQLGQGYNFRVEILRRK